MSVHANGRVDETAPWACDGHLHLALVEIANFAALRRSLGLARADRLIAMVAARIAALAPAASATPSRRDRVEVWLRDARLDAMAEVAATLRAGFDEPLAIDGETYAVQLSIGIAAAPGGQLDAVALVEKAEAELAAAYVATAAEPMGDDRLAPGDLRAAMAEGQLFLQYQPKLHVRRQKIASIEALIRWHHPCHGLIMPNDFIPLAERSGDIGALTLWTLRQVIADQATLRRNGHDLPVFINMAGALLSDPSFVDQVIALVEPSGAKLGIEITETSVIRDPTTAIRHLRRLADIGVAITIDDYGAGLSSLAYLKQLPATELKIDKLFVTELTSSHRDPLIVRSTIDLAHALEMEVVAEGVETAASLALLTVMGCDMVQGYLISRPLALEALLAFLRDEGHLAVVTAPRLPFERLAAVRARA